MPQSQTASRRSAPKRTDGRRRGPGRQLLGSETPRLFTKPRRPLTPKTTAGFEAIEFAQLVLGLVLLPWQRWLLLHMLELNPDGTFRFRTVVILVARQNGKTTLMQVVALWRMYVDGVALVIGTAQNLDVAEEAWAATVELAESTPELAREIKHVDRTNGKKALRLTSGERYKVAASSRRGGRGLTGDTVLLDELREHKNWESWSAVSKTTMARTHAQIIGMSNAGDGQSVVLHYLRKRALAKIEVGDPDTSLGLFEWSAPEDAAIDDRQAWAMANPSLGYTITETAIAAALETDDEDVFRTEVLCQWVTTVITPTVPPDDWEDCFTGSTTITGALALGVDADPRQTRAAVAVAGKSEVAGRWHAKLLEVGAGTDWLADVVITRAHETGATIWLDPKSAGFLIPKLVAADVPFELMKSADVAPACGAVLAAVTARELEHEAQEPLDEAVVGAATRRLGEGFAWTHVRGDGVDITPLVAVTWALWGAMSAADDDYDVEDSFG